MGLKSLLLQNKTADFNCTECYSFTPRKVFKTHAFNRWMKKAALTDADLGGHIVKKRVALEVYEDGNTKT